MLAPTEGYFLPSPPAAEYLLPTRKVQLTDYALPTHQFAWSPVDNHQGAPKGQLEKRVVRYEAPSQPASKKTTPPTPAESQKTVQLLKLAPRLLELYQGCDSNFSKLAYNAEMLSKFLSHLLVSHVDDAADFLILFEKEKYDTPIELDLSHQSYKVVTALAKILAKFPNLQTLTCYKTTFSDDDLLAILRQAKTLSTLELTKCVGIQMFGYDTTAYARILRKIYIVKIDFGNVQLYRLICECALLTKIYLETVNGITFEAFEDAPLRPLVVELTLKQIGISDKGLCNAARLFPNLHGLILSHCPKLTDKGFCQAPLPKSITTLDLADGQIANAGLTRLCAELKKVQNFGFLGCKKISQGGFIRCNAPETLTKVVLAETDICGKGLQNIFRKCPKLTSLDISHCEYIDLLEFRELAWPETLKKLVLYNTLIDIKGASNLIHAAPYLESVDLRNCSNLPEDWQTKLTLDDLENLRAKYGIKPASEISEIALFTLEL